MKKSLELNAEIAEKMVDAGIRKALELGITIVAVVLDSGGHLLILKRMDGVQVASIDIAVKKAYTAFAYKRPTKIFQDQVNQGNLAMLALPDMLPFEGGLPVIVNNELLGSIGVSGAKPDEDGVVARSAIDILEL